jgi:hypothetical protein
LSDPICSSAGCTQYAHKKTPRGYPIDYPVPAFGEDPEILGTANSISIGEAMHKHKLIMGTPESKAKWHNPAKDTMYNFAPELDGDIKDAQAHLGYAEDQRQHKWVIEDLQLDEQNDPICGSGGCDQYKHKKTPRGYPIDYPVASHGPDPDIVGTANAISIGEAMHQHKLVMGTPESKAKWHNPAKDTMYNFAPDLDKDITDTQSHLGYAEGQRKHKWEIEDLQLANDPQCSSSGECWRSKFSKTLEAKIVQYPDPEAQGLDSDVLDTLNHHDLSIGLVKAVNADE